MRQTRYVPTSAQAGNFIRQAERCRRLARAVNDDGIALQLEQLAEELLAEADERGALSPASG
jgi:hypothetical protein